MRPTYRYHAFISYAHDDVKEAIEITQKCQDLGLRLWTDIDPGNFDHAPRDTDDPRGRLIDGDEDTVEGVIKSAIDYSIIVIVITSVHTLSSVWVRKEIQLSKETQTPVFFWHIVKDKHSEKISIRRNGFRTCDTLTPWEIEHLSKFYHDENLPTVSSRIFMKELASKGSGLNIVGHQIGLSNEIQHILFETNTLIELSELILHYNKIVNIQNLIFHWPEYLMLMKQASELQLKIEQNYGKEIEVGRVPFSEYFSLKRPFVKTRIKHYERLLEDEEFRKKEFLKVDEKLRKKSNWL